MFFFLQLFLFSTIAFIQRKGTQTARAKHFAHFYLTKSHPIMKLAFKSPFKTCVRRTFFSQVMVGFFKYFFS